MILNDFECSLNIDYCGGYIDANTKEDKAAICIRLYLLGEKENPIKKYGINFYGEISEDLEEAITTLDVKLIRWIGNRYGLDKTFSLKEELLNNTDLTRKFNKWLSMKPSILSQARTLEVNL